MLVGGVASVVGCGPKNEGADGGTDTEATADTGDTTPTGDDTTPTGPGEADCGACFTLLEGDVSPSGDVRVDGVIVAVDRLRTTILGVQADYAADMRALADIYGLPAGDPTPTSAAQLVTAILEDRSTHAQLFQVVYRPANCYSDVEVAAQALAQCEIDGGCDVPPADGRPAVQCEGTCIGACAGICEGALSCVVAAAAISCKGLCDGTCAFEGGLACDGTCHGECQGECALQDGNGMCAGPCAGECVGTCDAPTPAACPGACSGDCRVEPGSAQCLGDATCAGQCSFGCEGECVGRATPLSRAMGCPATKGCEPQAAAQGSASVWCTPPVLDLQYVLNGVSSPDEQGGFVARTAELHRRSLAILHGSARLQALLSGTSEGKLVFDPPPLATVTAAIQQVQGLVDGLGIPVGRLQCVAPALQAAVSVLADAALSAQVTLEAQATFAASLSNGV